MAGGLDWVIVRENSEGEYAGVGGRAHQRSPLEVATVGPLPDFASSGYDCNHHSSLSSRRLAWPTGRR